MTELAGTLPTTIPDHDIHGVVHIDGLLFVSGRNGGASSDHKVYIVDPASTTLLGSFSIPEPHQTSSQGARDLATDLAGNILAAGAQGVACFDRAGNQVSAVVGNNGPILLPLDGGGIPVCGNQRGALDAMDEFGNRRFQGLAFDPAGDNNNGSFIVGEAVNASPLLELRISDATILKSVNAAPLGSTAADIDTSGLALDPETGTLWTSSSGDFGGDNGFYELDWSNVQDIGGGTWSIEETGRFIGPPPAQPGMRLSTFFGGLDVISGGDPGSPWGASHDLMATYPQISLVTSRNNDFISFHRLHQFPGVPGYAESFLASAKSDQDGSNMTPFSAASPLLVDPGDRLFFKMDDNGRPNVDELIAMIIINFPASAGLEGVTPLAPLGLPGNFPELVSVSPFSIPADPTSTALLFGATVGSTIQITTNLGLPAVFSTGDEIRCQFIYFEPASPILGGYAASNESWFLVR